MYSMRGWWRGALLVVAGACAVPSAQALDPEALARAVAEDTEARAASDDPVLAGLEADAQATAVDAIGGDPARPHGPTLLERVAGVDGLYAALGGREGIARFIDDTVERSLVDARIAGFFANADIPLLKQRLTDQVCQLAGGPCVYEGADMASAHAGLGIRSAHFNVLVEHLQAAMRAAGVPVGARNRLVALLAPMRPHIVGR